MKFSNTRYVSVRIAVILIVAIIVLAGILIYVYSFYQKPQSTAEIYQSEINSSNPCDVVHQVNIGQNNTSFWQLISNIESNKEFTALEQNRTGYFYDGNGCQYTTVTSNDSTTTTAELSLPLTIGFRFIDSTHPFEICDGTSSADPYYQITVVVDLTPSGYDLSQSTYSSMYYGATNATYGCTTNATSIP